jgi:hypothetical protein
MADDNDEKTPEVKAPEPGVSGLNDAQVEDKITKLKTALESKYDKAHGDLTAQHEREREEDRARIEALEQYIEDRKKADEEREHISPKDTIVIPPSEAPQQQTHEQKEQGKPSEGAEGSVKKRRMGWW